MGLVFLIIACVLALILLGFGIYSHTAYHTYHGNLPKLNLIVAIILSATMVIFALLSIFF